MKPRKSILDPSFRYRPSHATSVQKTWAPFLRLAKRKQKQKTNVVPMKREAR